MLLVICDPQVTIMLTYSSCSLVMAVSPSNVQHDSSALSGVRTWKTKQQLMHTEGGRVWGKGTRNALFFGQMTETKSFRRSVMWICAKEHIQHLYCNDTTNNSNS